MSLRWPIAAVGSVLAVTAVIAGLQTRDAVAAGGEPAAPRPGPVQDGPLVPVGVTNAARTAGTGALVASAPGLRVERVQLPKPQVVIAGRAPAAEVLRLTIQGRFEVRDAQLLVFADGKPVGRAIEAPDLRSITAVVPAPVVQDGTKISYAYGIADEPIAAGTLRAAK
jgi:hypothetical protein